MFKNIDSLDLGTGDRLTCFRHDATGLQHAHVVDAPAQASQNDASSYACLLAVPTPAEDNRGATHALEHMVLCGSRQYPYRDAFFKMERRSVAQHLNAVTNEWLSTFHFHTRSVHDFNNLVQFFFDSVFQPLLTEETFAREVVCPVEGGNGRYTGVVFNEMQGMAKMSVHVLNATVRRQLFDGSAFGFLSGGDPASIPDLTLEDVRDFHSRHYRINRAWLVTSGGLDLDAFHDDLEKILEGSGAAEVNPRASVDVDDFNLPSVPQVLQSTSLAVDNTSTVVAWDFGWRADEYAFLKAQLLLDVLAGRSDSLLQNARRTMGPGEGEPLSHLNSVDGEASRTVLRLGLGNFDSRASKVASADDFIKQLAELNTNSRHLVQAIDRLALNVESGAFRGSGNDPLARLRQIVEVLLAKVSVGERRSWLRKDDPLHSLRDEFSSPEAFKNEVLRLIERGPVKEQRSINKLDKQNLTIGASAAPDRGTAKIAKRTSGEARYSRASVARDLPIASVQDLPGFPCKYYLSGNRQFEIPCYRTEPAGLPADLIKVHVFFNGDSNDPSMVGTWVHALELEGQKGCLQTFVSTRLNIDTWSTTSIDRIFGGLSVTLTGLTHNRDELLDALRALITWRGVSSGPEDIARLASTPGRRIETALRAGNVTAYSAALRDIPGLSVQHHGSGLGLVKVRDPAAYAGLTPLGVQLRSVIIEHSEVDNTGIDDAVQEILQAVEKPSAAAGSPWRTRQIASRRSVFLVPGLLNYVARVFVPGPPETTDSLAARYVVAAALRNGWLLDAIRGTGGAYGTGVEVTTGTFGIWSYRDPRLERSFEDFDIALQGLADGRMADENLDEAKLVAITQLNRRFLASARTAASLAEMTDEHAGGAGLSRLYEAIKHVDVISVQRFAQDLLVLPKNDVALAGEKWKAESSRELDAFDIRIRMTS